MTKTLSRLEPAKNGTPEVSRAPPPRPQADKIHIDEGPPISDSLTRGSDTSVGIPGAAMAPSATKMALQPPQVAGKPSTAVRYPPDLHRLSRSYGMKPGSSLTRDLQSPDAKVRLAGLRRLEKAPGNWDAYITMVAADPHPSIKRELLRVMLKHEDQISPHVLHGMLASQLSPETPRDLRFVSLGELSFLKTVDVGPYLTQYARDPDERFRRSVVQTVAHRVETLSPDDVRAVLTAQIQSDNPDHRLLAVELMAKKRAMPVSPYLAMCAGDNNPKLRQAMYRVLADADRFLALPRREAQAIFAAELSAPHSDRRLAAIKFMKALPEFGKRSLLEACVADASSDDKVRKAAQKALKALN